MLDMIKPIKRDCVTLSDLKRCKMTPIFFDTFFNLEKYMEHEQRDPFAAQKDSEDVRDKLFFGLNSNALQMLIFFHSFLIGTVMRHKSMSFWLQRKVTTELGKY